MLESQIHDFRLLRTLAPLLLSQSPAISLVSFLAYRKWQPAILSSIYVRCRCYYRFSNAKQAESPPAYADFDRLLHSCSPILPCFLLVTPLAVSGCSLDVSYHSFGALFQMALLPFLIRNG